MKSQKQTDKAQEAQTGKSGEDFHALSRQILRRANRNASRMDFLKEVSMMIMKFSGCDALELWLKEEEKYIRCRTVLCLAGCHHFQVLPSLTAGQIVGFTGAKYEVPLAKLSWDLMHHRFDASSSVFTDKGAFWTGDAAKETLLISETVSSERNASQPHAEDYRSLALIPLNISQINTGVMQLRSREKNFFCRNEIESYEDIVELLAITLLNQRSRAACRERVKELTCLYGIAKATEQTGAPLEEVLQSIADLLPLAWQYPEATSARIVLDGHSFSAPGFWDGGQKQSANIVVNDEKRGVVDVVYLESKPELDEGPFLREERTLIDNIAHQIAMIIEQREGEEEKTLLEDQLRHADRLATIGQLAAGVAHELNEPLGGILGFAQLAEKNPAMPDQAKGDIQKIIAASLHAREIINKLKLFARQSPPQKLKLDLNRLIEQDLTFLESRCAKAGIELKRQLSNDLPKITADKGQLHQVLVNLVVNSIQAMPQGGKLTITTMSSAEHVLLIVDDTGVGMDSETMKKIFIPFFTTKDVSEGTGLGLAVVDGIISSHGGSIKVNSQLGQGTRVEIQLPLKEQSNSQDH